MSFSEIIMWVMAVGALVGGADRIFGNKLGLGEKFEEGFNAMGPLALGMVGIVCLAPVLKIYLEPIIAPAITAIGADPAIFGSILPNDTGGFPLAMDLAINKQAGLFSGLIVASMLGCTIVFSIPVGLGLIEKKDQPYFAKGLLIGMLSIPVGSIVGGMIAGYEMNMVIINSVPVVALSALLAVGLKLIPDKMIRGCILFGEFIVILITIGLSAAAFQSMTNVVLIPNMAPIGEALTIIGQIGVVLLGTFPVLSILTKVLDKPLTSIGQNIGLDSVSTAGLIFTLANSIPVYKMMKDMTSRGKIVNTAWLVPATAALGDHLGFTAGVMPEAITAVVLSKLIAGVLAVGLALAMTKDTSSEDRQSKLIEEQESQKSAATA